MLRMRAPGSDRVVEMSRSIPKDKFYDGALLHRRFAVGELRFVFDTFHDEFLEGWNQRNSDDQDVSSSDSEDFPSFPSKHA